jgi:hypothetical protein
MRFDGISYAYLTKLLEKVTCPHKLHHDWLSIFLNLRGLPFILNVFLVHFLGIHYLFNCFNLVLFTVSGQSIHDPDRLEIQKMIVKVFCALWRLGHIIETICTQNDLKVFVDEDH